jgi:hypothetical protein
VLIRFSFSGLLGSSTQHQPVSSIKIPRYHGPIEELSVADFLIVAEAVLGIDAERVARSADLGLASSALAPFAGFGETEFYPEPAAKAAILALEDSAQSPAAGWQQAGRPDRDARAARTKRPLLDPPGPR